MCICVLCASVTIELLYIRISINSIYVHGISNDTFHDYFIQHSDCRAHKAYTRIYSQLMQYSVVNQLYIVYTVDARICTSAVSSAMYFELI